MFKNTHLMLGQVVFGCLIAGNAMAIKPLEMKEMWFQSPSESALAQADSTFFEYDSDCTNKGFFDQKQSLTEAMINTLALDVDMSPGLQTLYKEYTQFWTYDEYYYQLSAVWDYDVPARYRLEFYRSKHAEMNQAIEQLNHTGFEQNRLYDALSVESIISTVVDTYVKKGAEKGAEIVSSFVTDYDATVHEVTFLNAVPVSWAAAEDQCFMNSEFNTMQCSCETKSKHHNSDGGEQ